MRYEDNGIATVEALNTTSNMFVVLCQVFLYTDNLSNFMYLV